jgi:hydroxymethylpyrimidine/phosphomethylpyrimidine kinase
LVISGFDPSGGAGLTIDVETFSYFKIKVIAAITALTIQTPTKVKRICPTSTRFFKDQLYTLLSLSPVKAVKIGMLANASLAQIAYTALKDKNLPIVLDPVIKASTGHLLLTKAGINSLYKFIGITALITPNIEEAQILTGMTIKKISDMEQAALKLFELKPKAVLIKGGHLQGDIIDILYDGIKFYHFPQTKISQENIRGTGCALASAITSLLALNYKIPTAIRKAHTYLTQRLKKAFKLNKETKMLGYF